MLYQFLGVKRPRKYFCDMMRTAVTKKNTCLIWDSNLIIYGSGVHRNVRYILCIHALNESIRELQIPLAMEFPPPLSFHSISVVAIFHVNSDKKWNIILKHLRIHTRSTGIELWLRLGPAILSGLQYVVCTLFNLPVPRYILRTDEYCLVTNTINTEGLLWRQ